MKIKLKENIELVAGSDGFWYDLTSGGYFKPDDVMADETQVIEMCNAIALVRQLEYLYEEYSEEM